MGSNIAEPLASAISALLSGDTQRARLGAERALRDRPDEPAVLHILALTEAKAGDYPEAIRLLRRALSRNPLATNWRLDLGTAYAAAHSWRRASVEFGRVVDQDGGNIRALSGYAMALLEMGETEQARSYFLRLKKLRPDDPAPTIGVARSYFREQKPTEAVEVLGGTCFDLRILRSTKLTVRAIPKSNGHELIYPVDWIHVNDWDKGRYLRDDLKRTVEHLQDRPTEEIAKAFPNAYCITFWTHNW